MADEDFTAIEKKALKSGAKKVYVVDLQVLDSFKFIPQTFFSRLQFTLISPYEFLQEDFVKNYVFPVIRSNAIYESRYLLGTSLARPCIAKSQVLVSQRHKFVSCALVYVARTSVCRASSAS